MDLAERRRLLNRKGSDVDMMTWEKVGESSNVVNEQSVTLSKPCTEIIIIGEGLKALQSSQIFLKINNSIHINGSNDNLNASNPSYYLVKLKVCGYGIIAEMRGNTYSLTTFIPQHTAIVKADITEITSVKMITGLFDKGNAFTSGKFEIWGR